MIYSTPSVGLRQPDCYGKFSRLLAELITRFSLLNSVLLDAVEAFQSVTSSFDFSIISFNLNHKLPDLYRDCVNHISFEPRTCRTQKSALVLNKNFLQIESDWHITFSHSRTLRALERSSKARRVVA